MNKVLVLDFGSQYTQLIARKIRELGIYSEIFPFNTSPSRLKKEKPGAIILSGGPQSVDGMTANWYPADPKLLSLISSRIVNEVEGVNRVVYDTTTKPPGTIEWE